jgi:hypothetical protein
MEDRKYLRRYGKLIRHHPVVMDEEMFQTIKRAIENGFDFHGWARDLFTDHFEIIRTSAETQKQAS